MAGVGELREMKPHRSVPSQGAGMSPAQRKACGVFHYKHTGFSLRSKEEVRTAGCSTEGSYTLGSLSQV